MSAAIRRSYLYVPALAGQRLDRAHTRGADAVIVDLEDAIAESRKAEALRDALAWLTLKRNGCERWVRVNTGERGAAETAALVAAGVDGICLPKVSGADDVERSAMLVDQYSAGSRRPALMPMIESACGLDAVKEIASGRYVLRLQLGELDLAADLGLTPAQGEGELQFARSSVVLASAVAQLMPPLGAVFPDFRNLVDLAQSTQRLQRLGFIGRAAIHPAQIPVIHAAFRVTPEDEGAAHAIVRSYEAACAAGEGVIVGPDGRMLDEAVVRVARRRIALAGMAGADRLREPGPDLPASSNP